MVQIMKKCVVSADYFAIAAYVLLLLWKHNVYQTVWQGIFLFFYLAICAAVLFRLFIRYVMACILNKHIILMAAIVLALAVCLLCRDQVVLDIPLEQTVQITALGEKAADAKGAEVWITEVKAGGRVIPLGDIPLKNGWIYRQEENAIVAYPDDAPAVLQMRLERAGKVEVSFVKHAWSGKAEIKNGQKERFIVDLYSSKPGESYLCILKGESYQSIFLEVFSYLAAGQVLFLIFCVLYILYVKRKEIFILYGMAYTFWIFHNTGLYNGNRLLLLTLSAVYGIFVYSAYAENENISVQGKKNKFFFVFVCAAAAFLLFGAKLFLIPENVQAEAWILFPATVLWCVPLMASGIGLFERMADLLNGKRPETRKKTYKVKKRFPVLRIGISILSGLMIAGCLVSITAYEKKECTVTVTPMGEKNEKSLGYEVWLGAVSVNGASLDPESFGRLADGWEIVNGMLMGNGTQGLTLRLPEAEDIKLLFNKHEWSGIVKIEDGGHEKYIDLFAAEGDVSYLEVYQVTGNRQYRLFGSCTIIILSAGVAAAFMTAYVLRCLTAAWKEKVQADRFFRTILLTELLLFSVYILASYPASICIDGRTQLLQAFGYTALTDAHPAVHTLLMKLLTVNGRFIAGVPVFQMLCLSFANAAILSFLYRRQINRKLLLIFGTGFPIMINHGIYITVLWKDELYSISLLILTYLLYRVETDKNYIQKKRNICCVGIVSASVRLLRHNGIIVYLIILFVFAVLAFLRKNRKYLFCALLSILLVMVIRGPVYDYVGVESKSDGTTPASMLHGLVYAGLMDDVPEETEAFLTGFMPMNEWEKCFHPYSANELFTSDTAIRYGVSEKLDLVGTGTIWKEYCRVLCYRPLRLIEDRLTGTDLMWNAVRDNGYNWRVANNIYEVGVADNTMGLYRHDNIFTEIIRIASAYSMQHKVLDSIFWRAGIWVCMLLLLIYYGYSKKIQIWMLYIPVIGNMVSLCLAMAWQDFRYVYFINLCVPYLGLLTLSERNRAKEEERQDGRAENSGHDSGL